MFKLPELKRRAAIGTAAEMSGRFGRDRLIGAMRRIDIERLEQRFEPGDARTPDRRFSEALGVNVPNLRALGNAILADLSPDVRGVTWWADHLPFRPRVRIADQLWSSVTYVEANLVEASLHVLEARDQLEIVRGRGPEVVEGTPLVRPHRTAPIDFVPQNLAVAHVVAAFRAVGSALDALGAAVVGVAALPTPLMRTSLAEARRELRDVEPVDGGTAAQQRLSEQLEVAIVASGPLGWLEWTTAFRNMVIHRGRHLWEWRQVRVDGYELQLPRNPQRGWVDSMLRQAVANEPMTLGENAETTLAGVLASVCTMAEAGAGLLSELWLRRRAEPALLRQPAVQWLRPDPPAPGFAGYAPNPPPLPRERGLSAANINRMRAAALDDESRNRWAQEPDDGG